MTPSKFLIVLERMTDPLQSCGATEHQMIYWPGEGDRPGHGAARVRSSGGHVWWMKTDREAGQKTKAYQTCLYFLHRVAADQKSG